MRSNVTRATYTCNNHPQGRKGKVDASEARNDYLILTSRTSRLPPFHQKGRGVGNSKKNEQNSQVRRTASLA